MMRFALPLRMAVLMLLVIAGLASAGDYSLVQYLNIQTASAPSMDPHSIELLYVTNISGVPQVWRQFALGSYQSQVTFDTNGVERAWWSPRDPDRMIVSASVGGNERSQLFLASPYAGPWERITADDAAIYTYGDWQRDGSRIAYASNERNKTDFDVYEYELEGRAATLLYKGESQNQPVGYSPDGRHLLIVRSESSFNSDILLYDRQSNKTRLLTKHKGDVVYRDPVWSGDGKGFYFLTDQGRDFIGLAYWPLDSAAYRWVETPDWDVEDVAASPDGTYLAWTVNEDGYSRFHFRNLQRGTTVGPGRLPTGIIRGLYFSPDSQKLLFAFGSATRNSDLWIYETVADRMHQITYSATGGIPATTFREPELVRYASFDGKQIPAFWFTPATAASKMPVIVFAHGGPESQARPDLSGLIQYYLSRGYGVLVPNVRGSSGYGKTYMALDNVRKRLDSVQDYEYAARWLKAREDVDPNRLVIYGGSYGGYIALASLTHHPETWAAGVSVVGIANFVTFLEKTGPYRRAQREAEYGSLKDDRDFLAEISPLTHVDKIKAPLLLIQGANDPRVPQYEADQMAAALRERGRTVEYLLFADEGHGLKKTQNRITAYSAMADFLQQHVPAPDLGGK